MKITGIILAGGKSSRMGTDKGLLSINGSKLTQYTINALKPIVDDIIIVSNNKKYEQFNYPVYRDLIPEKGPIGGIFTGLSFSKTKTNVVISCDTPFVTKELINLLISKSTNYDLTIPKYKNKTHFLIGVYSKNTSHIFENSIKKNELKLGKVIEKLNSNIVNVSLEKEFVFNEKTFTNINSKEDFDNACNK